MSHRGVSLDEGEERTVQGAASTAATRATTTALDPLAREAGEGQGEGLTPFRSFLIRAGRFKTGGRAGAPR
jgi:hypothetical protein